MRLRFDRRTWTVALAAVAMTTAISGCKRPSSQQIVLTKDQEQQIAENVLAAPPAMQTKTDIKFEDKITLIGYDVKGLPAKKGATVDLTMYFRVDQPVVGDWKIFLHFEAPGKRRQPFDHYGVGGLYPIGIWKKGEIVRDTVSVQIPADWPDGPAQVLVGFFDWGAWSKAQQNRRLKISSAGTAKVDADDRVLLTTVDVGGGGAAPGGESVERLPRMEAAPAVYTVGFTSVVPVIDGKLEDAVWQAARPTEPFRQPDGQPLNGLATAARLAWDAENLYVGVATRDDDIRTAFTKNDSTLWEGDVIELFLALPGKEGQYVEFQWNPAGARFDALFTGPRTPAWEEAAKWESRETFAVSVDGSLNADAPAGDPAGNGDRGWSIEAAIPWKSLGFDKAPDAGTRLAANLYRIDSKGTHELRFMGTWAPVGNDFHQLAGAGTLVLGEAVAPSAVPAVPAVAPTVPAAAPIVPAAAPTVPAAAPTRPGAGVAPAAAVPAK